MTVIYPLLNANSRFIIQSAKFIRYFLKKILIFFLFHDIIFVAWGRSAVGSATESVTHPDAAKIESVKMCFSHGPVAQLGACLNGIQEVEGSIPFRSTKSSLLELLCLKKYPLFE